MQLEKFGIQYQKIGEPKWIDYTAWGDDDPREYDDFHTAWYWCRMGLRSKRYTAARIITRAYKSTLTLIGETTTLVVPTKED